MDADVIESAGRMFPVEVRHAARDISSPRDLPDAMARAVRAALAEHEGDILAFLPGMAEIRRTQAALADCGALVLPLHGELPPAEQDRALRPAERRRVVLATSIAETSLTVPGVRIVVDGGWRRAPRLDASTGLTRLTTLRISRAAAEQRAGRAGREAPGVAIRLWSTALHRGLAAYDRPEILEAELSGLALDCAAWGAAPGDLPFLDPPPQGALAAATALLTELGALDATGRITDAGSRMAALGAHPRLAAMMLAARTPGEAALAADLAALLEERDPLRRPDAPADIGLRLAALADGDPAADRGALSRIRRVAARVSPADADRRAGRWRSGPPARRRLPRPHRPAPRRARQLSAGRRRRGAAAARRSAGQRAAAGGRVAGAEGVGPHPAGGAARSRHPARRSHHRAGGDQLRSGLRRGAGAPAAAARGAGADRPHRTGGSRRGVRRRWLARWRPRRCDRCPGPMRRASFRRASR